MKDEEFSSIALVDKLEQHKIIEVKMNALVAVLQF
jgi:hypothetical protein